MLVYETMGIPVVFTTTHTLYPLVIQRLLIRRRLLQRELPGAVERKRGHQNEAASKHQAGEFHRPYLNGS